MQHSIENGQARPAGAKEHAAVSVFCRIRPLSPRDLNGNVAITTDSKIATLHHGGEEYSFAFDRVFDVDASQIDVFEGVKVVDSVRDILEGYNATIFAYGQTASGKTHTMEGGDIFDALTRGIVPRSAEALFQACLEAPSEMEFAIKVSFVEIYMERIRDLLDAFGQKKANLQIREDPNLGVYVAGCTESFVTNEKELLQCMIEGHKSRATAATGMNEGSSRSHSVLSVTVQQKNTETDAERVGKLVLVDLAGSEMVRKTHAAGQQLEEAKVINKSLSALGQVINALTDERKAHVPYRNSKLTRMLQDSLGGNAKTALIVAVSAAAENSAETLSTLKFGNRAKAVKNRPKVNERKSFEELTALLHKAEAAIDMQSTYITALELQIAPSPGEFGAAKLGSDDVDSMATILDLQKKISILNDELTEERAESRRCDKEARDLTTLLHEKERLLLEAGELMMEVESKMEETVCEQARLIARNETLEKAKSQLEQRSKFRIKELELRLEKISAVDARLRKEDADDAAMSQGTAPRVTASHCFDGEGNAPLRMPNSQRRLESTIDQRTKLIADLSSKCDIVQKLQQDMADTTALRSTREQHHMRSLQQRLEQLVAVHRQLLRKYAALELNLGEANKMIALRDEHIFQLERECERRYDAATCESQRLFTLMRDLDLRLLNKRSVVPEKLPTGPRTLRGGSSAVLPSLSK